MQKWKYQNKPFMAKTMGPFRYLQAPPWLSGPRTDVPAELPSHRPWLYLLVGGKFWDNYVKFFNETLPNNSTLMEMWREHLKQWTDEGSIPVFTL
jgi:hypothetical protein